MLTSPIGKVYIGQTTRPIEERFKKHQQKGSGCVAIYNAIQKYGWDNFEKDWYECPDDDLNKHEELMIEVLGTLAPDGYNLKEGGGNGKYSEESKKKMSEALCGKKNPNYGKTGEANHMYGRILCEETKKKMSEAHTGKPHSDETKQKIKEANLGKMRSDETKQNVSEALRGEKNYMYGKTHTEETKQKMSESMRGEKNHMSKRVYQYDLDDTFVCSFGSLGEATRHLEKKSSTPIWSCANGKSNSAYGFKWSYNAIT